MKTRKRGYTMAEMVIAMALTALLMATLFPCLLLYSKIYSNVTDATEFNRQKLKCQDIFSMDALVAQKFTINGTTLVISRKDKESVTYTLESNKTLTRKVGTQKITLLRNVDSLTFKNPSGNTDIVHLEANLRKDSFGGNKTVTTLATTLVKRN